MLLAAMGRRHRREADDRRREAVMTFVTGTSLAGNPEAFSAWMLEQFGTPSQTPEETLGSVNRLASLMPAAVRIH